MAERQLITGLHRTFLWEGLTATDTGSPLTATRGAIIGTVQMLGTFGGEVSLRGSINGSNWFTLIDRQGNPIVFTAEGAAEFSTAARHLQPLAGSGVSDVDILLAFSA